MNIKGWPKHKKHMSHCRLNHDSDYCSCGADDANAMLDECAKAVEAAQSPDECDHRWRASSDWKILYCRICGKEHKDTRPACGPCKGTGYLPHPINAGCSVECPHCKGTGLEPDVKHLCVESSRPSSPENISPLPWRLGSLDRPWKEFVAECDRMSDDQQHFQAYSIAAGDDVIVCLFGPGPKSYENAKFIMDAVTKVEATTGGKVACECKVPKVNHNDPSRINGSKCLNCGMEIKFTPGPVPATDQEKAAAFNRDKVEAASGGLTKLDFQEVLGVLLNANPDEINTNFEVDLDKVARLICEKFGRTDGDRVPTVEAIEREIEAVKDRTKESSPDSFHIAEAIHKLLTKGEPDWTTQTR